MLLALRFFCAKVPPEAIPCVTAFFFFFFFLMAMVAFSPVGDIHSKHAQLEGMPMFYILLTDKPFLGIGVLAFRD